MPGPYEYINNTNPLGTQVGGGAAWFDKLIGTNYPYVYAVSQNLPAIVEAANGIDAINGVFESVEAYNEVADNIAAINVIADNIDDILETAGNAYLSGLFDMMPEKFGAVGDGVTNDKAAIDAAADENNGQVYLTKTSYKYGNDDTGGEASNKMFFGPGIAKTGVNKRGRKFGYLNAAPAIGDVGSVVTAFNGDFTKSLENREFRVGGSLTLGNPTSGQYIQRPECAAIFNFGYVASTAGKNLATDWTDGRTGWAFSQTKIAHFGQGDANAFTIGIDIWNNKADGTHFLSQPAGNIFNGGVTAWVNNVNAVVGEFYIKGQSYDINGTGFALHFERNNATGAQEAMWRGISIISAGSQPMDEAFVLRGKVKRGLSTYGADLGVEQAAVVMAANQRIYGNATRVDTGSANALAAGFKIFGDLGDDYFYYNSSLDSWTYNNDINLVTGKKLKINNVQVLAGRDTGWTAMTGGVNKATAYDVTTVTLGQLAARVAALQSALTTHGILGA